MTILELLKDNPAVVSLLNKDNELAFSSDVEEALVVAAAFLKEKRDILLVKNNLYSAERLYDMLYMLLKEDVYLFACEDSLRIESIASSPELKASKIDTLNRIDNKKAQIVVTHGTAFCRYLANPDYFRSSSISIKTGDTYSLEELERNLIKAGYEKVARVDQPLTFAKRGGIIDIFTLNYDNPIRIEFFDTEIDSIRFFDLSTQRTISRRDDVTIIPATEILYSDSDIEEIKSYALQKLETEEKLGNDAYYELKGNIDRDLEYLENHINENYLYRYFGCLDKHYTIADYLKKPLVILSPAEEVFHKLHMVTEENITYIQELYEDNKAFLMFSVLKDVQTLAKEKDAVLLNTFNNRNIRSGIFSIHSGNLALSYQIANLAKEAREKKIVLWLNEEEIRKVSEELIRQNIEYSVGDVRLPISDGISVCLFDFKEGFELYSENIAVYTSKELFERKTKIGKFARKFKEAEVLSSYQDLEIGDYIVHNLYGIGQYMGIITREDNNVHKDFLNIVYRGGDVLLVPLEQFQLVRKFVSREGVVPRLNKLGTAEWSNTKAKIQSSVNDIAERLIALYSDREKLIGHAFLPDSFEQKEFEKEFQYELTPDQKTAIDEVKKDMESAKPMDRLICGDVGFGKTEVAIRAAFKAVMENKQVAFLCPTTILAHQHYDTFRERFKNYPVNIVLLNRFVTPENQREVILKLKNGSADIIIGTHRILSKDVVFKDLGLLIIDEEQRFGVEHKEKIKELKQSVDVLSLSATPIPRTLQMSLIGIRSLSQLNTPPNNRMPVLTYVIEKNRSVIKDVIERELARDGQVFYLYNNISNIYSVAAKLKADLPDAKIAVAHGKMSRIEIEDVMMQFIQNEYNVLICTTIIETGIDIPNANTILIENADRFGLSQLYQIKGRVGRSDRLAYAYLMYEPQKQLTEIASKRLQAIKEFTELGSGYKIAMRDLTIRGAGDLLGAKQSGFIDTVGIDMYIELLNQAIAEKKGIAIPQEETTVKPMPLELDAYIPEKFAPEDYEKITLYQRINRLKTASQLEEMETEIIDQYGRLPEAVRLLFEKKRLELLISEPRVKSFREKRKEIEITFTPEYSSQVDGIRLFELVSQISREIELKYLKGSIILKLTNTKNWLKICLEVLQKTKGM